MTGKERITNILQHKPVDRIGLFEHFWSDTYADWRNKGHISEDVTIEDTFGFDMSFSVSYTHLYVYKRQPERLYS